MRPGKGVARVEAIAERVTVRREQRQFTLAQSGFTVAHIAEVLGFAERLHEAAACLCKGGRRGAIERDQHHAAAQSFAQLADQRALRLGRTPRQERRVVGIERDMTQRVVTAGNHDGRQGEERAVSSRHGLRTVGNTFITLRSPEASATSMRVICAPVPAIVTRVTKEASSADSGMSSSCQRAASPLARTVK